jgi:aldehyde dehydrogenase (NAD+)
MKHTFFPTIAERIAKLEQLRDYLIKIESEIIAALYADLKKSEFEAIATEIGYVHSVLNETIKKLPKWAAKRRITPALINFPSRDYLVPEPYGKVLVIAPWNYPYQLSMVPVISALAAGNSVVLKPSEFAPKTALLLSKILRDNFDVKQAVAVLGDAELAIDLLSKRWDYIFFTGSVNTGKHVALAAAKYLTPTTLELGGKNPCIVDRTADLDLAARRIVWGKFLNNGQTCIAPDFLLVHNSIYDSFLSKLQQEIKRMFGDNVQENPDYGRIVNRKQFLRLKSFLHRDSAILYGGSTDEIDLFIEPTLLSVDNKQEEVMKSEIFGPILPLVRYESAEELNTWLADFEKPLAFYVFSNSETAIQKWSSEISAGGICVNDTLVQFTNNKLPFGGVGESGHGAYHGIFSFETFSHLKPVVRRASWLDLDLRYPPYGKKLSLLKRMLKYI